MQMNKADTWFMPFIRTFFDMRSFDNTDPLFEKHAGYRCWTLWRDVLDLAQVPLEVNDEGDKNDTPEQAVRCSSRAQMASLSETSKKRPLLFYATSEIPIGNGHGTFWVGHSLIDRFFAWLERQSLWRKCMWDERDWLLAAHEGGKKNEDEEDEYETDMRSKVTLNHTADVMEWSTSLTRNKKGMIPYGARVRARLKLKDGKPRLLSRRFNSTVSMETVQPTKNVTSCSRTISFIVILFAGLCLTSQLSGFELRWRIFRGQAPYGLWSWPHLISIGIGISISVLHFISAVDPSVSKFKSWLANALCPLVKGCIRGYRAHAWRIKYGEVFLERPDSGSHFLMRWYVFWGMFKYGILDYVLDVLVPFLSVVSQSLFFFCTVSSFVQTVFSLNFVFEEYFAVFLLVLMVLPLAWPKFRAGSYRNHVSCC